MEKAECLPTLLKKIMRLEEKDLVRSVFVRPKEEGGINLIFEPEKNFGVYQVYVQSSFPFRELFSHEFPSFRDARNFAASFFKTGWDLLHWDGTLNRPCAKGESCGGGNCSTSGQGCGSADGTAGTDGAKSSCGGGCTSCSATKEFDELMKD